MVSSPEPSWVKSSSSVSMISPDPSYGYLIVVVWKRFGGSVITFGVVMPKLFDGIS